MIPKFLDNALGFNIYRVGLLFRRELIRALTEYKMTPEQWQVMATLWTTGHPLNQNEIVSSTLKDKPTISRMIKRLEKNGWVERKAKNQDGRVTIIQLTNKGKKYEKEISQKVKTHFRKIFKHLEKDEGYILINTLKKLRHLLGD